jgi:hypothetical protein
MDELDVVRDFRAAEPAASDVAKRTARAALTQTMGAAPRRRPGRVGRRRALHLRALLIPAGAIVATVAVLLVLTLGGSPTGPSPAAAAVFRRLANLIATQSFTPHRGQYLYIDSRSVYPTITGSSNCETFAVTHRQIWIGANGSGLLRETTGRAHYASAADRAACMKFPRGGRPRLAGGTSNTWFAANCLTLGPTSDWRSLSTNPRVLLRQMRRIDGGPRTPSEDFVHIGDFLRETDAPPRVRAAIYRAAALIPGVRLLGWVHDHDGRRGLGVAYSPQRKQFPRLSFDSELIFNSRTGELMGEQGPGRESYWAVYLHERVVKHLPGKPPAPLTPACRPAGSGYGRQTSAGTVITGQR